LASTIARRKIEKYIFFLIQKYKNPEILEIEFLYAFRLFPGHN
jgi:hypothetical protein